MHGTAFILSIIGGLNWLLYGLFGDDIFGMLGWSGGVIAKIVYILIGLSAVYLLLGHKKDCKSCDKGMKGMGGGAPMGGNKPM